MLASTKKSGKNPQGFLSVPNFLRSFWLTLCVTSISLPIFSHFFFESFLFMRPCMECVLIRFAFMVVGIGAFIVSLCPRSLGAQVSGALACLYGIYEGLIHSHNLIVSQEIQSCSLLPTELFPFGLPMDRWIPSLFNPTGLCGMTTPIVPQGIKLTAQQSELIDAYLEAGGWYLLPTLRLGSMAECTLVAFSLILVTIVLVESITLWQIFEARNVAEEK